MRVCVATTLAASFLLLPPAALADVVFDVSGSFNYGGTLTGSFTTDNNLTTVLTYNLVASSSPGLPQPFPGFMYTPSDSRVVAEAPLTIAFESTPNPQDVLVLSFQTPLSDSGADINNGTNESEGDAGSRSLISGTVTVAPSITPEPSSVALFGTGLLGLVGVIRKRLV